MNKDCKIVQDLLPSYIDGLTNKETNEFIEAHIKECKECQNTLNSMREKLSANTDKVENGKVSYLKKYNRELRVLQIIVLIILVGFILNVGRKYMIIESLHQKFNETTQNLNNYYLRSESYNITRNWAIDEEKIKKGIIWIEETYYKDGDFIKTTEGIPSDYENGSSIYRGFVFIKKGNEKQAFSKEIKNEKIVYKPMNFFGDIEDTVDKVRDNYYEDNFFKNLYVAIFKKVEQVNIDDRKCYVIENIYGDNRYVDAETGITIRTANIENINYNDFRNTYFEAGNVKDSDIAIPDM